MSAGTAADASAFGRVFVTLLVYVVFGPLVGMAVALAIVVPLGMASFGPGMAGALVNLVWSNPWLPYAYGLLPAAATGVVLVVRQARSGTPGLRFVALAGALVALLAALFSGGHFPSTNPVQIAVFTVAGLVAAPVCALVVRGLYRGRR